MHLRDKLINDIRDGIGSTQVDDNSNKSILARGCDPEMGRRAVELLPPILGKPEMVAVTNDDDFMQKFTRRGVTRLFHIELDKNLKSEDSR